MLIPDFYSVQKIETTEGAILAAVRLNPDHEIYKGHFPEQPVVPGVLQLQIIREILEESLDQQLFISRVNSAKYLRMITPVHSTELQITIRYKTTHEKWCKVDAIIGSGQTVFTKLKAEFTISQGRL